MEVKREPRDTQTYEFDLKIPVDTSKIKIMEDSCFGKLWDLYSRQCPQCADKDICAILFKKKIDADAKKVEDKIGSKFLDTSDFDGLKESEIKDFIVSGKTTTGELIAEVSKRANSDDKVAIINWIKRFVKGDESIYTKDGIVWIR